MIKMKALAFMTILMLALTGCGKAEQEPLRVYSFSGENEQLTVSNGIMVQRKFSPVIWGRYRETVHLGE